MDTSLLDNPLWHSLRGGHADLARHAGDALWYGASYAPFVAVASADAKVQDDVRLAGRRYFLGVAPEAMPERWRRVPLDAYHAVPATLQLVRSLDESAPSTRETVVLLGPEHRERMRALTRMVYPEFFREHTAELGTYVGILHENRLIAMAGERMVVPGAREISAVCTHPDFAGRGLAKALLTDLVNRHREQGLVSFLHVSDGNAGATRLYEKLGFHRRTMLTLTAIDIDAP
ncbi:MAG: Mycothiol acetyltransferase [Luteibacter sp.]|uniref:GNAT family N-acetyltransferase n=1 Tax=Luteibacter sp. TaxID=1886636 RepID=UPI00138149A4|nr:GNAT family N-acetyltransferase [Luteibacter sp.]KAF1008507.1 MAG: Mycothiol acetyltransferase [Luteibacter sp.]